MPLLDNCHLNLWGNSCLAGHGFTILLESVSNPMQMGFYVIVLVFIVMCCSLTAGTQGMIPFLSLTNH